MVALFIALGVFVAVTAIRAYSTDRRRLDRAVRATPMLQIAAAAEGSAVRVTGRVAPGETVEAPLTGRRCVFYEVVVEQRSGKKWDPWIREARGVPFMIEDSTGRALIDPTAARASLQAAASSQSGMRDEPTPGELAFLARYREDGTSQGLNMSLRYHESVVEIGKWVAVVGRPVREPDLDARAQVRGYRDELPTRLRLGGSPDYPILISDDPEITAGAEA